jgi:hypothetical protein
VTVEEDKPSKPMPDQALRSFEVDLLYGFG